MNNVVKFANKAPGGPVADGTQPPHDGGMEARIAKLEVAVEYIQRDVGEIKADLKMTNEAIRQFGTDVNSEFSELRSDVSVIKERLNHTPTTLQMWAALFAVVIPVGAAVVGILTWVVQSNIAPLLVRAAGGTL